MPIGSRSLAKDDETSLVRESKLREEAKQMLDKARAIRNELPEQLALSGQEKLHSSPWNVQSDNFNGVDYRLYVDVGREEGVMDGSSMGCQQSTY